MAHVEVSAAVDLSGPVHTFNAQRLHFIEQTLFQAVVCFLWRETRKNA